ncbi:MAG TPA: NUDIX domain-containing protein [Nocardioidaceae bacterium]|nr:NUDIX domain-containing protein [Nocardioidaceae bacterium]
MTDRFVVVPAAYVLFLRPATGPDPAAEREVLLQLRQGTGYMDGYWATGAAGHVEKGESVYEAAAREAAEELDVHDIDLTPLCAMQRTGTGLPIDERVDYFFAAASWSGEPRIVEPDKCADLRWFGLDDLPASVVPHERKVLELIRAGDVPPILTHGF